MSKANFVFVVGLPSVRGGFNVLWVIIDCLTKLAHFILVKDSTSIDQLGQIYVKKIMRLYGMPKMITSDRNTRFIW